MKIQDKDLLFDSFAYLINELNNIGEFHPVNIDKIIYSMSQHNTTPWTKENIKNLIKRAREHIEENNFA